MSTGSNNQGSGASSGGAAALLGMFDPPPGAANVAVSAIQRQTSRGSSTHENSQGEGHADDLSNSERVQAEIASFSAMATAQDSYSEMDNSVQMQRESFLSTSTRSTSSRPSSSNANTATLLGMFQPPPKKEPPVKKNPEARALLSMFEPPRPPATSSPDRQASANNMISGSPAPDLKSNLLQRPSLTSTLRHTNYTGGALTENNAISISENTGLLQSMFLTEDDNTPKPTKMVIDYNSNSNLQAMFSPTLEQTNIQYIPTKQPLGEIQERTITHRHASARTTWKEFLKTHFQPTTFAGAFMFLLYHIVFSLAFASAQIRPHGTTPILGEMAKLTCVGIFAAGPFYIARLGNDVPAVYPSVDLFLAPFLASAAAKVDQALADDGLSGATSNAVFFASYTVLAAIGMLSAGTLLLLAATFKLANLGTFLPYSVLCGFFSAVGVLLWALSFSVDTNGLTWQHVFFSGDTELILNSLLHHLPSLVVGILMNILGPKHPFYVILLIIITVTVFYTTMFFTGMSSEEAQEEKWFWSREELSIQAGESDDLLAYWVPPVPFGHFGSLLQGQVHWGAVKSGLKDMFALAFLYLLRSSIHASAMKKNINNLVCKKRVKKSLPLPDKASSPVKQQRHKKKEPSYAQAAMVAISDKLWLVNESLAQTNNASGTHQSIRRSKSPKTRKAPTTTLEIPTADNSMNMAHDEYEYIEERPKPCRRSLQDVFIEYGFALILVAFGGGFGVCPTVATSNTMYAIGAGGPAPQYGSILLLIIFYLSDFDLVRYIPKCCFSSLLVLGAVDTFVVWFFLSYKKTQDLMEWMVVPFIVAFSLIVGFLNAVFLGVGISTFVFVGAFFRVGVVKFNATGLEIRSTIERSLVVADWLDKHGDYIQVLVLQNYLFFGNASSVLAYIATMFEDCPSRQMSYEPPPIPKVLIIDMSLNTGMDTSTLDIFAEIKELCKNNKCKLFLCGLSSRSKKGLSLTGVKAETGVRDQRLVRFFADLDTALGVAEDFISKSIQGQQKSPNTSSLGKSKDGFLAALKCIDEQHGEEFSKGLVDLEPHTAVVELQAGDRLFACDGGPVPDGERGLFFIESGSLKIERDANETLTRGRSTLTRSRSFGTLGNLHARSGTVGRQRAAMKATSRDNMTQTFRLARIGPGWICGAIEGASGLKHAGVHVAVTNCTLHHLPFQKLELMEKEHPSLILNLYKMLSHLMARRQEITIEQLATFHSIMSSPAHSKPVSRAAMMALRR